MKKPSTALHIVLGIEISCADRNHIVGIFPNTSQIKTELTNWLDTNLINKELGTYKTGLDVLEFISQKEGIGYIAHIDSADIFKGNKYLSEAYRRHLFSSPYSRIIGIKEITRTDYFLERIRQYRKDEVIFVLDNDSHAIDERDDAYFWIKCTLLRRIVVTLKKTRTTFFCCSCLFPSPKSYWADTLQYISRYLL